MDTAISRMGAGEFAQFLRVVETSLRANVSAEELHAVVALVAREFVEQGSDFYSTLAEERQGDVEDSVFDCLFPAGIVLADLI